MKARLTLLLWAALCAAGAAPSTFGQTVAPPARALKFTDERVALPVAFQRSTPDDPYPSPSSGARPTTLT